MRKNLIPAAFMITAAVILLMAPPLPAVEDPAELNRRGIEYGEHKMYDQAIREFEKSVMLYNDSSAKVYHNMGEVYEMKGDLPKASAFYEEAVRRNTLQVVTWEKLGFAYFRMAQYDKAVSAGEYVLKIDPKNQEVPRWLPDAYKLRLQKQQTLLADKQKEEDKNKAEDKKKEENKKEAKDEDKASKETDKSKYTGCFKILP